MTDKQVVLDALDRLPETTSLKEIIAELRILASIRRGQSDIASGRFRSHREVEQLFTSWVAD